jgi:hypothetical protein
MGYTGVASVLILVAGEFAGAAPFSVLGTLGAAFSFASISARAAAMVALANILASWVMGSAAVGLADIGFLHFYPECLQDSPSA